jgi:Calcineurin-like phosphoesterase
VRRRLIAIGDLHGDVHRLVRILERHGVLLPGTRRWARVANTVDVVLLGDYVDWRGEPLEGDRSTWERGVADLMELLVDLHAQVDELAASSKGPTPRFFSLLGNHDKLMLDSYRFVEGLAPARRKQVGTAHADARTLRPALAEPRSLVGRLLGRPAELDPRAESVLTWMLNGGVTTVQSFGGFEAWYERMRSGLATFMETKMPLGVVLNQRLYCHSVPDSPTRWKPVAQIEALEHRERNLAIDEWVWGRRIYGIDHKTGQKVPRPEPDEVDRMLAAMQVKGVVVGHSLMQSLVPVRAYDGKVVNIDLHGHPLSDPWLEDYQA